MATSTSRGSIWLACALALLTLALAASATAADVGDAARRDVSGGSPFEPSGSEASPARSVRESGALPARSGALVGLAGASPFATVPGAAWAPGPRRWARTREALRPEVASSCAFDLPQAARPPPAPAIRSGA
jgi:hypothetical protein